MGKSYRNLLNEGEEKLAAAGIFEAKNDAWLLLSLVSGLNRTEYLMKSSDEAGEKIVRAFYEKLERRVKREPVQYIAQSAPFYGYDFYVDSNVLIPRLDTEVLVEHTIRIAKEMCAGRESEELRILDMCTGSGCIILSVYDKLKERKIKASAFASDISEGALNVAKKNAALLNADVTFFQGNLFENVEGKYDIITSNPPYIRSEVIEGLEPEVKEFEPMLALDGYEDGLYFYRKIVAESTMYLHDGGYLIMEIGHDQGADVSDICRKNRFVNVEVIRDLAGLERVVVAMLKRR